MQLVWKMRFGSEVISFASGHWVRKAEAVLCLWVTQVIVSRY